MKKCNMEILDYRKELGISKDFTFGLEIEFDKLKSRKNLKDFLESGILHLPWELSKEITIPDGGEINPTILTDNPDTWNDLEKILLYLKDNAKISENCGGHIHIGAQIFENTPLYLFRFIILFFDYEDVILRHCYNEFDEARKYLLNMDSLYFKLLNSFEKVLSMKQYSFEDILDEINKTSTRNEYIYFKNVKNFGKFLPYNTIEFRFPNASFETSMWQNNVYLIYKLIEYCKRKDFNLELLLYNKMHFKYSDKKAYELAELLFDNSLDRDIFLNQVFKYPKFKVRTRQLNK